MRNDYKNKIKHHFNKSYRTYDAYCQVQNNVSQCALKLLQRHASYCEKIADFACGTGESTLKLINHIQYEQCYAIDFSDKLLNIAINKLPHTVQCILSDFEDVLFQNNFLDLVFCNMGLQWSFDFNKTLSLLNHYLKNSGYFIFSIPICDNFPEMKSEFKFQQFSSKYIIRGLKDNGFNLIDNSIYINVQSFQSHYQALKSLQAVGANFSPGLTVHSKGLKKMNVRELFIENNVSPQLTYCIGIYLCQKVYS